MSASSCMTGAGAPPTRPRVHQLADERGVAERGVTLLWRSINRSSTGQSYIARAHAPAWDGKYTWDRTNLFPEHSHIHMEDAFLWRNGRGCASAGPRTLCSP